MKTFIIALAFIAVSTVSASACVISGCTNPVATNYNSEATVDDESCVLPVVKKSHGHYAKLLQLGILRTHTFVNGVEVIN